MFIITFHGKHVGDFYGIDWAYGGVCDSPTHQMENAYGSIAQQKNDGGITMLENLQVMGSDDLCSLPTHHDEIPLADNIEEINTIDIERGVVHSDGDQPPKEKVGASRNAENEVKLLLYWP
ncbi:uncharacterized protein LOC131004856 isoform X3 [Salvia miltiorrhiza]|uniref:uncharacterized protein LOC131004856 isoform X3 n=1 Tax=Salvia miltiorrhiza TaxID=226208 RepID=UPI0025AD4E77|nr:uncharacterized protein LOC131004856 isoform X3 [Salvia miltiorrhiza]